jgi:hypothetical protein
MIETKQASEVRSSGFFPKLLRRMSSSDAPSMDPSLDMGFDPSDDESKKPSKPARRLEEEDTLFVQLEAGIFGNKKRLAIKESVVEDELLPKSG